MTPIEHLPYDLLQTIFDYLDVKTLLNACLTGHTLNEVASWTLYTSITFNPDVRNGVWFSSTVGSHIKRNPLEALERRPHLRNAVRNVTLCSLRNSWFPHHVHYHEYARHTDRCYKVLSLMPNITFLQLGIYPEQYEWALLSNLIPQLCGLRTLGLDLRDWTGDFPSSIAADIHAISYEHHASKFSKSSVAHKVRKFVLLGYPAVPIDEFSLQLRAFSRLTRLAVHHHSLSPGEICQVVAAVPNLREAEYFCQLKKEPGNILPTGARNLTDLRITFSPRYQGNKTGTLKLLVQCVAEQSRLQRLDIIAENTELKVLNGESLLTHIVSLHARTLEKLKLPNYHITRAKLGQLISQCDRLTTLWLGVTPKLKTLLPGILSKSPALEKLRIYADGTWDFMYAQCLLCQTCPTLREFKVCPKLRIAREKACWKYRWKYDDELQQPMILIDGPHSASFSSLNSSRSVSSGLY